MLAAKKADYLVHSSVQRLAAYLAVLSDVMRAVQWAALKVASMVERWDVRLVDVWAASMAFPRADCLACMTAERWAAGRDGPRAASWAAS